VMRAACCVVPARCCGLATSSALQGALQVQQQALLTPQQRRQRGSGAAGTCGWGRLAVGGWRLVCGWRLAVGVRVRECS
jgi:hypothetical protein